MLYYTILSEIVFQCSHGLGWSGFLRSGIDNVRWALYNEGSNCLRRGMIALIGELAVPCNLQSATAGVNPGPRISGVLSALDKQR